MKTIINAENIQGDDGGGGPPPPPPEIGGFKEIKKKS